jgi:hypothetical protein
MIATVGVLAFGGGSFAYFTATGSGSGSGSVGTPLAVTVQAATGTVTNKLFPGSIAGTVTGGDLTLTIDNPNSGAVKITGINQSGPVTVVSGGGCTDDSGTWPSLTFGNSGVSVPNQTGLSVSVGSGLSQVVTVAHAVSMSTSSASACQDKVFQIPVTITVQQP